MSDLSARMIRTILFKRDGNHCAYCNVSLSHKTATIDHITPVSKGGSRGAVLNMVLCCAECNQAKADRPVKEFLKERPVVYLRKYMKRVFRFDETARRVKA